MGSSLNRFRNRQTDSQSTEKKPLQVANPFSNPNSLMNRSKSIHDKKIDLAPKPLGSLSIRPVAKAHPAKKNKLSHMMYNPVDDLAEEMIKERNREAEITKMIQDSEIERE